LHEVTSGRSAKRTIVNDIEEVPAHRSPAVTALSPRRWGPALPHRQSRAFRISVLSMLAA
jgi:hypothetical protein